MMSAQATWRLVSRNGFLFPFAVDFAVFSLLCGSIGFLLVLRLFLFLFLFLFPPTGSALTVWEITVGDDDGVKTVLETVVVDSALSRGGAAGIVGILILISFSSGMA